MSDSITQTSFDFDSLINVPVEPPKLRLVQMPRRKRCSKCRELKDLDQFSVERSNTKDGRRSRCKDCEKSVLHESIATYEIERALGIIEVPSHKECTKCGRFLPIDQFSKCNKYRDGFRSWCKSCCNDLYRVTKTPERSRANHLLRKFNLTPEQYNDMLEAQGGVCAICGEYETSCDRYGVTRPLCVDHDHSTGQVRSLLCHHCNAAYGHLKEDESIILALFSYHEKWHPE